MLRYDMTSRERVLTAMELREPDHVPLLFKGGIPYRYVFGRDGGWRNQFERIKYALKIGIDDYVTVNPKLKIRENVKVRVYKKMISGEKYPILVKEYETPKGVLRKVVRQTPDWPHGDDIPLFTDHGSAPGRAIEYLVKDYRDLDALSVLRRELNDKELKNFYKEAERAVDFARKNEVPVICWGVTGLGDIAWWLVDYRKLFWSMFRDIDFLDRLLEIIHGWDMTVLHMLSEVEGIDVIVHRGWYENPDFWPPRIYRRFLLPRIKEEVDFVHKIGAKYCYIMNVNLHPLIPIFKDLGIDIVYGIDPIQGRMVMKRLKRELGDKVCLWGGVNSHVTLELGSRDDVRKAVKNVIETLAPGGGFILSGVGSINYPEIPIENIHTMIETWREMANYPLRKMSKL